MLRTLLGVAVACVCALASVTADARPRHYAPSMVEHCDNSGRCASVPTAEHRERAGHAQVRAGHNAGGSRPAGCPALWCGCGLALKLFGRNVRELWLARAWLKFPRVHGPVPGSVAVLSRGRGGHVGIVRGTDANGNPIVYSGNHNRTWGEAVYPKGRVLAYVRP